MRSGISSQFLIISQLLPAPQVRVGGPIWVGVGERFQKGWGFASNPQPPTPNPTSCGMLAWKWGGNKKNKSLTAWKCNVIRKCDVPLAIFRSINNLTTWRPSRSLCEDNAPHLWPTANSTPSSNQHIPTTLTKNDFNFQAFTTPSLNSPSRILTKNENGEIHQSLRFAHMPRFRRHRYESLQTVAAFFY